MTEYISLGSDCSIAYNLQKLNFRKNAYPFDWIKLNNINDLIDILSNNFKYLLNKEFMEIKEESDKFPYLEDNWSDILSKNIIIKHTKYSIVFPHEIKSNNNTNNNIDKQIDNLIEKYNRRIIRFLEILKNDSIKKIFIRISNKNEDLIKLNIVLSKICNNYEIKLIKINKKIKFSSWKKEELNWNDIFIQENHNHYIQI
jgi:hypothetical protein